MPRARTGAGSSASFGPSAARNTPPAALGTGEDPVEQCRQCPAEGELVGERLRKLEPLGDFRWRLAGLDLRRVLAPRQAPGAPAVRPQSFGNGSARQPGKLADLRHAQT